MMIMMEESMRTIAESVWEDAGVYQECASGSRRPDGNSTEWLRCFSDVEYQTFAQDLCQHTEQRLPD